MSPDRRTFLVECYAPGISQDDVEAAAGRARAAAQAAGSGGGPLTYLGALLVADDEAVFHAFQADDVEAVETASRAAGLEFTRIVESVSVRGGEFGRPLDALLRAARRPIRTEVQP